jgi:hypothetical protein
MKRLLAALAFLTAGAHPAMAQTFGPPIHCPANGARRLAIGDVNADGLPDVLCGISTFFGFALFRGVPGGTLTPVAPPGAAFLPSHQILVDLNGDGVLDMAAVDSGNEIAPIAGALYKFLGDGFGGFLGATFIGTTAQPRMVAGSDVNADGRVDLLVANANPGGLQTFLGTGGGAFALAGTNAAPFAASSLAVTDLDSDGFRDAVLCANGTATVSVYLGNGAGAFAPAVNYPTSADTRSIAAGDVDGDFRVDIVGACAVNNPGLSVLRGLGSGILGPATLYPGATQGFGLELADADGNGAVDAFVADSISSKVRVFSGNGSGGFVLTSSVQAGIDCLDVKAFDLDLDGRLDTVASNKSAGTVTLALQSPLTVNGIARYGTGSPGCLGAIALGATEEPKLGSQTFAFVETNAPRNALGILLATHVKDEAGSDPFFLGILLHCDLFLSWDIHNYDIWTDHAGVGRVVAAIPNLAYLVGVPFYTITIHLESAADGLDCGASPYGLVSSRGLDVVIQP